MSARLAAAFRRNVRSRMGELQMSQDALAKRLKVGKSFVSQMLSGHRRPGLESLESFAKALKVAEPAELIMERKMAESA